MKKLLPKFGANSTYFLVSKSNFKKFLALVLVLIVFTGVAMRFWTKEAQAASRTRR